MTAATLAAILSQIEQKSEFVSAVFDQYDRDVRSVLDFNTCWTVRDIIIVGSGDSYACGLSAKMALQRQAQLPVQALNAMTAARYTIPFTPSNRARHTLLICISISGGAARTNEALQLGQAAGMITLALTANPDSIFGQRAKLCLEISFPQSLPAGTPGVQTYLASQLALILIGTRIGEVTGRLFAEQAAQIRQKIKQIMQSYGEFVAAARETAALIASEYKNVPFFEFLGSGPNYGTAVFSAAKVVEISGHHAIGEDIEEFHHFQFFEQYRPLPTVLYAPFGNAYSRAVEIANELRKLQRPLLAVVQAGDSEIANIADRLLVLTSPCDEEFTPLLFSTVGELIAFYLAQETKAMPYRNFSGVWQGDALPYSGIKTSRRVTDINELR
jgi:glucosamine--fructose-6-phosphate aminotransferase (isomerizing)